MCIVHLEDGECYVVSLNNRHRFVGREQTIIIVCFLYNQGLYLTSPSGKYHFNLRKAGATPGTYKSAHRASALQRSQGHDGRHRPEAGLGCRGRAPVWYTPSFPGRAASDAHTASLATSLASRVWVQRGHHGPGRAGRLPGMKVGLLWCHNYCGGQGKRLCHLVNDKALLWLYEMVLSVSVQFSCTPVLRGTLLVGAWLITGRIFPCPSPCVCLNSPHSEHLKISWQHFSIMIVRSILTFVFG